MALALVRLLRQGGPMCTLYRLDAPARAIARQFGAEAGNDPWNSDYVAPGRFAPVVIAQRDGTRRIVPRQWGVPPPNVRGLPGDRPILHVRNVDSPFWIGNLRHTQFRCLVPVTSFMEWGPGRARPGSSPSDLFGSPPSRSATRNAQHWFSVPSEPIFAFAGIWRDSEVPSFAFLTTAPNETIARANPHAMPVILSPEDHEQWLMADWRDAAGLVQPSDARLLLATPPGQ